MDSTVLLSYATNATASGGRIGLQRRRIPAKRTAKAICRTRSLKMMRFRIPKTTLSKISTEMRRFRLGRARPSCALRCNKTSVCWIYLRIKHKILLKSDTGSRRRRERVSSLVERGVFRQRWPKERQQGPILCIRGRAYLQTR